MVRCLKAKGWLHQEAQKELAERRKAAQADTATLESARAKVRRLELEARQQLEKHEKLKAQCDAAKAKLETTAQSLATAKRAELEFLAKEHAAKAARGGEAVPQQKTAISIDLTTLLGEEEAPIEINFGGLLDDFSDVTLTPEEKAEKEELEKSFGIAAGQAARQQFEPMLQYLRKQAELQKAFNARAAAKRRRVGVESDEPVAQDSKTLNGTPQQAGAPPAAPADDGSKAAAAPSGKEAADFAEGLRIVEEMRKERFETQAKQKAGQA